MVNILEDNIWNSEPALKPEDEIMLRKLHEMLQSTAEDLKVLSGELSKFHEPGVQIKSTPMAFDEEFNEKIHIEEVVNAKFFGHKLVDKPNLPVTKRDNLDGSQLNNFNKPKVINIAKQLNTEPTKNRNYKLTKSKTKVLEVASSRNELSIPQDKIVKEVKTAPTAYNEFVFKQIEVTPNILNSLQIQQMPSINIRSELREQKVLQLDIIPEIENIPVGSVDNTNIAVISLQHDPPSQIPIVNTKVTKISRMSAYESSESINLSSDVSKYGISKKSFKTSPRSFENSKTLRKNNRERKTHFNVEEWKKKLNSVYGQPGSSKKPKSTSTTKNGKLSKKIKTPKDTIQQPNLTKSQPKILNNAEYIPYTQLTLGGARVSDVEKELSNIPNKTDIPLSPILDKILSRENSPRKVNQKRNSNIFTTSDENLLQEVLDIERSVNKTITKNTKNNIESPKKDLKQDSTSNFNKNNNFEVEEEDSYVDDFEEEKSNPSNASGDQSSTEYSSSKVNESLQNDSDKSPSPVSAHNVTYTKNPNLTLKNCVDVFEFVHSVDTQDTATQSHTTHKISLKETQTSPRNETSNLQPIHNDLWPAMDPQGEVEKMFKLEKELIKKMILEEYGDLLEKNITKPSTSQEHEHSEGQEKNIAAFQKNTQTSPAHVKSVMTSPTRVKTRTTSPLAVSLKVDHKTSPLIFVTEEKEIQVEIEDRANDLDISINLSSPRFSLRLPQTSREVLSNLDACSSKKRTESGNKTFTKNLQSVRSIQGRFSSSSTDEESSDIRSIGEVRMKLRKRLKNISTSSVDSRTSRESRSSSNSRTYNILPLKSEGEISASNSRSNKYSKSEGEASYGKYKRNV